MVRLLVICAGCALAITTGAIALTGDPSGTGEPTAAARQYGGVITPPPPPPPPPPPLAVVPPAPPPPPPPAALVVVPVTQVANLASNKKCLSRRSFGIRLRAPKGDRLVEGRVFVNGKQVRVLRGKRLRAKVVLKGLPKGRYVVKITVRTRKGKRLSGSRRYRTCAPKLKGGVPKL